MIEKVKLEIALQPFGPQDINLCFAWANDAEVVRYLPSMPRPLTWKRHVEWARAALQRRDRLDRMVYVVNPWGEDLPVARAIGRVHAVGLTSDAPEVGVLIGDKTAWGQGAATQAIGLLCEELVRTGPWKVCIALIHPENDASKIAFGKNGFLRDSGVGRAGQEVWIKELRQ